MILLTQKGQRALRKKTRKTISHPLVAIQMIFLISEAQNSQIARKKAGKTEVQLLLTIYIIIRTCTILNYLDSMRCQGLSKNDNASGKSKTYKIPSVICIRNSKKHKK